MHDQSDITIVNRKSKIKNHLPAIVILLAFVALCLVYSQATPPFEAGDESRHYAVVKYMVDTGRLITQNAPETEAIQHHWSHEGNQPPLYYALAATLTFWIDTGSYDDTFWYNPHTTIGNPLRPDNKNIVIHPPDEAWQGAVLAVQLARLLSIVMATITIITCYLIALRLFKGNRWQAAGTMAITAFNPMFIFISASVNNDNAVIMFVTIALWAMVQLAISNEQLTNKKVLAYAALLGVLIGLGALSKLYAFGLLPLASVLFIWLTYKRVIQSKKIHPPQNTSIEKSNLRFTHYLLLILRTALVPIIVMIFTFLMVAGWFYLRNALIYNGDIFALQVMRETAGQREQVPTLATLRAEFEGFRIAYWALFGGVNILVDTWIYTVLDIVSVLALVGVITFTGFTILDLRFTISKNQSKIDLPAFTILLGWCLIMIAGFIVWNLTQPAGQGRLLYPAIAAISALTMLGLSWWLPDTGKTAIALACAVGLFLFAAAAPFLYIAPAYAKPPILTQADLPADIQPINFTYDDAVRLIGYQLHATTVQPAETLPITLYWELLQPVDLDYSVFIHLLGRQRQNIGQIDSYPGGGKWPTTLLSPGDILADSYEITITPEAEFDHAPTRLQIAAGIYDYTEPGRPGKPAVNTEGQPVEPIIGAVKLVPWQWPQPTLVDPPTNFFDKTTLQGYTLNNEQLTISNEQNKNLELTLYWKVDAPFEADYTVFIQAWDVDTNEYVTGFDGPPVLGDYPTSLWEAGETIVDAHPLDLSQLEPGNYKLLVGLYNPTTGDRLPAFGPDGPLQDYAVNVGTVQVPQ